jgi:hypothetical protein
VGRAIKRATAVVRFAPKIAARTLVELKTDGKRQEKAGWQMGTGVKKALRRHGRTPGASPAKVMN